MPMHELAVCQSLIDQVEQVAREQHADRVVAIHLGIGPLSGVEAALLEQAFSVARAGSIAATAELVIENTAIRVSCTRCGAVTDALPSRLLCGDCGDWHTRLVSGDELLLQHVEIIRQAPAETTEPARQQRVN
jgi:hydrogenase nickel incorporation protein HypA/HybF